MEEENVVVDVGYDSGRCGYCGSSSGFFTHGMVTSCMRVQVYQDLLDVGWRRSGTYIYRPDVSVMCCPAYTIRLHATEFVPSKSQKKAMRKLQRYLDGGPLAPRFQQSSTPLVNNHLPKNDDGQEERDLDRLFRIVMEALISRWCAMEDLPQVNVKVVVGEPSASQRKHLAKTVILTSPSCMALFFALRGELESSSMKWHNAEALAESLCSFFDEIKQTLCCTKCLTPEQRHTWREMMPYLSLHQIKGHLNFHLTSQSSPLTTEAQYIRDLLSTMRPSSGRCPEDRQGHHGLAMDSDVFVSKEASSVEPTSLPEEFCIDVGRRRSFTTSLARSSYLEEEYALYRRYQMAVHNDPPGKCGREQYRRFLVESPLIAEDGIPDSGFGAFHMQYRIDGRLVAVGVVDVLPRCLSSKYFFWDPDFAPLSLGKISALKEIEWIQWAQTHCQTLQYYYMGFYIHSCPKMRYKGSYEPSELLCPQSLQWVTLTDDVRSHIEDLLGTSLSTIPGAVAKVNEAVADLESDRSTPVESQSVAVAAMRMSFGTYMHQSLQQIQSRLGTLRLLSSQMNARQETVLRKISVLTERIAQWKAQVMNAAQQLHYCVPYDLQT